MNKITAVIITLNEEKHIGDCIDSLSGVADEIVVLDSCSTDRTKEMALSKGAKVIDAAFTGFGPQRNRAAASATYNFILVLDADERLSPELKKSISNIKIDGTDAAYSFNRLNFIGQRAVKTGDWYPDAHVRLYDRRKAKWNDRQVHEDVEVNGEIKFLHGDLLHYSFSDISQVKTKSTHYAKLGAGVYRGKCKLILFVKMIFSPGVKFFKTYFILKGFTDGYVGLLVSYYRARETFLKYYWALV